MSDYRVVQCFGVKRRPKKKDVDCRQKYLWVARGASSGNFGRKGAQSCPNCGTTPDFMHPYNRFLGGDITLQEAEAAMPAYIASKQS